MIEPWQEKPRVMNKTFCNNGNYNCNYLGLWEVFKCLRHKVDLNDPLTGLPSARPKRCTECKLKENTES